jgi:hypothetical protein
LLKQNDGEMLKFNFFAACPAFRSQLDTIEGSAFDPDPAPPG